MKTERIIWGLLFLFIGGILLLDNFEVIDFHWEIIWRFWPLVLIIIGANLIFSKEDSAKAGVIAIIVTIAALAFIGYQGTRPEHAHSGWFDHRYHVDHFDDDEKDVDDNDESRASSLQYSEAITPGIKNAELNIEGGATKYTLSDTTSALFQADVRRKYGNYSLFKLTRDSIDVLNFKMKGKQKWDLKEAGENKATLKLNTKPIWDVNLDVGAGKIDFDLTSFKIRNVSLEGGAASFYLKLGQPQHITTVNANTGVSEIKISIPESAACQIKVDSGLSSNDFEGFEKQADGTFKTPGFNTSSKKIVINLQGGLSKFEVDRY